MARNWIVVGDAAEGGGQVLTGSPFTDIDGKAVARIGDKAHCGRHGGVFDIVTGDHSIVIDGQPVARQGDRLACGCRLLTVQQSLVYVDAPADPVVERAAFGWSKDAQRTAVEALPRTSQPAFDQAVRFVGSLGEPLAGVDYVLSLEDGTEHRGVTDSEGATERVGTEARVAFYSAALTIPLAAEVACCARGAGPESVTVPLEDIATTSEGIGTSVRAVKVKRSKRRLTAGEVAMARMVFKDSIDYDRVWIHNGGYPLFLGLQNRDTAVAPNGQIYFIGVHYKEDFSIADAEERATLIHELTHVWQFQLGYPVKRIRVLHPKMGYAYTLGVKQLHELNMEAQGHVLADYYVLLSSAPGEREGATKYMGANTLAMYQEFLKDFIEDPSSRSHLPTTTKTLVTNHD